MTHAAERRPVRDWIRREWHDFTHSPRQLTVVLVVVVIILVHQVATHGL